MADKDSSAESLPPFSVTPTTHLQLNQFTQNLRSLAYCKRLLERNTLMPASPILIGNSLCGDGLVWRCAPHTWACTPHIGVHYHTRACISHMGAHLTHGRAFMHSYMGLHFIQRRASHSALSVGISLHLIAHLLLAKQVRRVENDCKLGWVGHRTFRSWRDPVPNGAGWPWAVSQPTRPYILLWLTM